VFLFIGLTFTPFAFDDTFMRALGRDLSRPADRRRHLGVAVDGLMRLLAG
jgi:hypothetical protein